MSPKQAYWTNDRIINRLIYLAGIVLIFFLLRWLGSYLVSFFLAAVLAFILEPIVKLFQRLYRTGKRGLAVASTLASILALFTLLLIITIPMISKEASHMGQLINDHYKDTQLSDYVPQEALLAIEEHFAGKSATEILQDESISPYVQKAAAYLFNILAYLGSSLIGLFGLITFILYLVFIMLSYDKLFANWEKLIPPAYRGQGSMMVKDVKREMVAYFHGQSLVVLWMCILFAVGFSLISLPMGIMLGIITGLLNYIPYMQLAALLPATFLAYMRTLETGQAFFPYLMLVLGVFLVVQVIQDGFLVPRIMGNITGLNPAIILLSLTIWGGLLGIVGMVIALPMTSLIIHYYKHFVIKEPEPKNK